MCLKVKAQFVQNTTFGLWEKTIAQLRKMFRKVPMNTHATISCMLLCWFVYAEALFDFEGRLEKTLHRKTLVMDSLYACRFIKKRLQHRCFLWILQDCQEHLFCETSANRCCCCCCCFDSVNTFDVIRIYHVLAVWKSNLLKSLVKK